MHSPMLRHLPPPPPGQTGWPWTEESACLPETMPDGAEWPRISIVTPSYNQARYVEEAVRSVLLQGYPNLEYVVMDGGSTDGAAEILRRYEPFLTHLQVGPDGGQAAAIAQGFRRASGEILAWINSDDRYEPGAFARVAIYFSRHRRVVFVNSDVFRADEHGRPFERSYVVGPCRAVTATLGWHSWPQPGCFWRRTAYERCGGMDETLRFCMDRDLFLRLTAVGPSRRLPGAPTATFRYHPLAKSSTLLTVAEREGAQLIERYSTPLLRRIRGLLRRYFLARVTMAACRKLLHRSLGLEF